MEFWLFAGLRERGHRVVAKDGLRAWGGGGSMVAHNKCSNPQSKQKGQFHNERIEIFLQHKKVSNTADDVK